MIKRLLLLLPAVIALLPALQAQDSIQQRVILIGDAGEINNRQNSIISSAAGYILQGKTTVVYLGDNVYPTGMGLPGSKEEMHTEDILRAQYGPMRSKGAPVYFIPGNHDWDRMGKEGLQKIKAQWNFLQGQQDSLLQLVPPNGCPGPVEIPVSANFVILAFDSEWWLFPHNKDNAEAGCDCNTKEESIARFEEMRYRNRYKMILLADHHPFKSYGRHGGYFSLKDHLFPFTAINKNLYIPLPVAGSLYPLLRRAFATPEDAANPLYRDMVKRIDGAFDAFPNKMQVSGHEHGMQFIKNGTEIQVVSGAGAKEAFVKKGKYTLYASAAAGFVVADQLQDKSIRFTYYTRAEKDTGFAQAFRYNQPYTPVKAQEAAAIAVLPADSITVSAHAPYNSVSKLHRRFFGENYRQEWAAPTTLPVIKISEIKGGLTPTERGGGHQSYTLRLKDKAGKEWVLRSVNKYPEVLLPPALRETFAADIVKDAMSAQHPYSALIVPPIANAAEVPHSNPVIGWVAPDEKLGLFNKNFAGTVDLLEEREPLGKSDNTEKAISNLIADNDNNMDSALFLRARLLDVLVNDWDRHNDQWRWLPAKNSYGGKTYTAIPRDRDQVFYINEGLVPEIATRPWLLWFMQGFSGKLRNINDFMWESRQLNGRFLNQFSYENWMSITHEFANNITDSVLETALQKLPPSVYAIRHDLLLRTLKTRRDDLPAEMNTYYHFINKIVDIQTSDKNELVQITGGANNGLLVSIRKLNKKGETEQQLFCKTFDPSVTKEVRLFTGNGSDSVVINTGNKHIKLRIVGNEGQKTYNIQQAAGKILVYNRKDNVRFAGSDEKKLRRHLSNDSANTAFVPADLYNKTAPLVTAGFNVDDGLLLGAGLRYTHKGFRKAPWASMQKILLTHSFSTNAFRVQYSGEWNSAVGKANILLHANVYAPDNTQNFFGRGNETVFIKSPDDKKYYRVRFNLYDAGAALKWGGNTSFSIGPALQYYHFNADENKGRFILNAAGLNSYDSATLAKDKIHGGIALNFINDRRNNSLIPTSGSYVNIKLQGFAGLNSYSKSYLQIAPEAAVYRSLNAKRSIVLANRIGGGATLGSTAFYQSLFLDGKDNLMGYRQYRFAGQYSLYNNLELRIKLTDFASYVLPGQLGMIGLYDIGRVWEKGEHSNKWHSGTGGGFYFAPAGAALLRVLATYSTEGWYPYISLGFRF